MYKNHMPLPRFVFLSILLASTNVALSQSTDITRGGFRLGASLNYSELVFDKEVDALNDVWGASPGYQVHVLFEFPVSKRISLLSGLELISNRYKYIDSSTQATNNQGEPTSDRIIIWMKKTAGVTYLGLPVHVHVYPLKSRSLYLIAGPELAFKIGHQNSTLNTRFENESGDEVWFQHSLDYDIPERSRDLMVFASAGVGYRLDSKRFPIDIQLKARHSITTFMADKSFIDHWVRSAMVTVSYGF